MVENLIQIWAKYLIRYFTKEDRHLTSKFRESSQLVIRVMLIKTVVQLHQRNNGMVSIKRTKQISNVNEFIYQLTFSNNGGTTTLETF